MRQWQSEIQPTQSSAISNHQTYIIQKRKPHLYRNWGKTWLSLIVIIARCFRYNARR
ncbi:hypothetical protein HMPREF1991_00673 [Hoylesella loescheii DSM 19665 = JCM 12249 = ATCC 15930]|uniref:Uncharacterized protein n=1 Tax=Hoylesella loescheii DSM 19665 = JCM 12249 = ATCC 15930 TaxID=1122985 RepID=A0A069QMR9_HOYLO|nr:hypothetical protein HMPREF1991_00673 [Hoylesella loescheii DSM 19665 = JCM 12249 = ATCC 15930]